MARASTHKHCQRWSVPGRKNRSRRKNDPGALTNGPTMSDENRNVFNRLRRCEWRFAAGVMKAEIRCQSRIADCSLGTVQDKVALHVALKKNSRADGSFF